MKRHKYKFHKQLLTYTQIKERHHILLNFLRKQNNSLCLQAVSERVIKNYFSARSRIILYCLVTGRIRSTLSIINTSRHIFFWSVDRSFNTGFVMAS